MKIITTINALRRELKKSTDTRQSIGFVPTMGCLHEGHLSLVRRSKTENDLTVMSIFVNPTQFGPHEDFTRYPREKKNDVLLAKKNSVDIMFYPSVKMMYADRYLTSINVKDVTDSLCGASRPGHFSGVATVVGKLLNIVQPDRMYLGQKDAQQCVVLKQMVLDLNFPVKIVVCPTLREPDGLAMSSRNRYLNPRQRQQASVLSRSLFQAKRAIASGERNATRVIGQIRNLINQQTESRIDYVACVGADNLQPLKILEGNVLIALAVFFGQTRLIDNITVKVPQATSGSPD